MLIISYLILSSCHFGYYCYYDYLRATKKAEKYGTIDNKLWDNLCFAIKRQLIDKIIFSLFFPIIDTVVIAISIYFRYTKK